MLTTLVLLAACNGTPPTLTSVSPVTPWPGDALHVIGEGLDAEVEFFLARGELSTPLPSLVDSEGRVQIDLPPDTPTGAWSLMARGPAGFALSPPTIEVWTPDTEAPCTKRYALSTETHRTQRKIAFTRTFPNHEPERHVFLGDQLGSLALQKSVLDDGRECSSLWLIDAEGTRWLIADDAETSLRAHAQQIASALELPLQGG